MKDCVKLLPNVIKYTQCVKNISQSNSKAENPKLQIISVNEDEKEI
jgi:hypothetical protein